MRPEDFRPDDLFAQIQGLVDGLAAERDARHAAEAADKAKSDLLAMIGHELRTPMEAVVAMSELLLASPLDPTQARYTETLYQSGRSLLSVLNDVLDFSRLEAGRFELEQSLLRPARSDPGGRGAVADAGQREGSHRRRRYRGELPAIHRRRSRALAPSADQPGRQRAEIHRHGAVRLHASANEIDGRLLLRFDVTDTGVGLSKAVQERLFQPYLQLEGPASSYDGGTGLSLSIARKLALLMGGEIGCESVVGQGTHYWFVLPAGRARMAPPAPKPENDAQPQPNLSGHVLVVEDNAVNRMLIVTYLDEFGLTHEVVASGGGAVMSLASKTYDLVLMDTAMRDLDGVETTRRIRSLHAPSSHVPIVALVAHGMTERLRGVYRRRHGRLCVEADPRARALRRAGAVPGRRQGRARSSGWSKASLARLLPV